MSRFRVFGLIAAVYAFVWLAFDGLGFAAAKDETHLWPTTLLFSRDWLPGLSFLRDYPDLNTPLPFLLWGWLERLFHGGIAAGRRLNFVLSLAMTLVVASGRTRLCAVGLLLFPYFLGTSAYLYTDILAASFVLAGVSLHLRGRFSLGGLAFILGVSCRQVAAAFPAAMLMFELSRAADKRPAAAYLWPLLSASTVIAWFFFFGGFAPAGVMRDLNLVFGFSPTLNPRHALYFLSVVGLYFVLLELALLDGRRALLARFSRLELAAAAALLAAFIAFPPLDNRAPLPTFGLTDSVLRGLLSDSWRMACYYVLAAAAAVRLLREPLALSVVAANAAVLCQVHVAWEKYALPALAVLWYLRSRDNLAGAAQEIDAPGVDPRGPPGHPLA